MFIVTGVSKGLGKAIVHALLKQGENVIGIGRSHQFNHSKFSFIACDLSDIESIKKIKLPVFKGQLTLINNAGIIGDIKRLSDQKSLDLLEVLRVNTIAPTELTNVVYRSIEAKHNFRLVNISSGAANAVIPSWGAYCASKAALNMLTEAFFIEEKEKGNHIVAYAVSPGVIDTEMQGKIRSTNPTDFSAVNKFIHLKEKAELFSPKEAAERLLILLKRPFNQEVKVDLRNING
ncbi:MAG: SDR family NAD(P)-dependent oxidoreductase [Crocinitomicaceae bacterium]|nr:SDR family NAD(P)-dependent oxidoreductase [Crocinitomicaceae bacterium]MDG1776175.1 SDR family NAD(P)-dependent oxidoreductase [Crocinitomicaceae bacterium]